MCGACREDGLTDARRTYSDAQLLMRLALINGEPPSGPYVLQMLLRRVLRPEATLDEIGQQLGITRQAVQQHCAYAREHYPELARLLVPRAGVKT